MTAPPPIAECRAARLPKRGLAALAPLRQFSSIRVIETNDSAWVTWDGDANTIIEALLPVDGIAFYTLHDGCWRLHGASLPDFNVPPMGTPAALDRVVVPARLDPTGAEKVLLEKITVTLVPCRRCRPTSAIRCSLDALTEWCENATTHDIECLNGAVNGRVAWLRGTSLPMIRGAERFWGDRVLSPLGMRPDPDWPERALRRAAIVEEGEILVLAMAGTEALPLEAFRPLTRSAVRRLAGH